MDGITNPLEAFEQSQDKRQKLVDYLLSCTGQNPEAEHCEAERLLLDWIGGDVEKAWKEASENWWYA